MQATNTSKKTDRSKNPDAIKVFIVDDSNVMIDGFIQIFKDCQDIQFVGRANNGQQCLTRLKNKPVDVLLMDINMPLVNGIDTVYRMKEEHNGPLPKIIFLTVDPYEAYSREVSELKASFVGKNISANDLIRDIKLVHQGKIVIKYDPQLSPIKKENKKEKTRQEMLNLLTDRQLEIIYLLSKGHKSKSIATELGTITEQTVNVHRRNILAKLEPYGVTNVASLIAVVMRYRLFDHIEKKTIKGGWLTTQIHP